VDGDGNDAILDGGPDQPWEPDACAIDPASTDTVNNCP